MMEGLQVEEVLKNLYGVDFIVKSVKDMTEYTRSKANIKNQSSLSKQDILRIIKDLKKLNKQSDYLLENYGIDLMGIENRYMNIIEVLFSAIFNRDQLRAITFYLFDVDFLEKEDKVFIVKGKEEEIKTLHQLWGIIQKLK